MTFNKVWCLIRFPLSLYFLQKLKVINGTSLVASYEEFSFVSVLKLSECFDAVL
jgi:hypothetical protein